MATELNPIKAKDVEATSNKKWVGALVGAVGTTLGVTLTETRNTVVAASTIVAGTVAGYLIGNRKDKKNDKIAQEAVVVNADKPKLINTGTSKGLLLGGAAAVAVDNALTYLKVKDKSRDIASIATVAAGTIIGSITRRNKQKHDYDQAKAEKAQRPPRQDFDEIAPRAGMQPKAVEYQFDNDLAGKKNWIQESSQKPAMAQGQVR